MSTSTDVTPDEHARIDVDHQPVKLSSYVAVGAAIVAALTSAPFALLSLPLGVGGIAILAAGLFRGGNRGWVTISAVSLFLSVMIAGGFGTPAEFLLVSMAATLVAWNTGMNAIGLGEQLGRHSKTRRAEIVHASTATIVAMVATGFGYAVYATAGGGRPVAALGLILLGMVLLVWAIRT